MGRKRIFAAKIENNKGSISFGMKLQFAVKRRTHDEINNGGLCSIGTILRFAKCSIAGWYFFVLRCDTLRGFGQVPASVLLLQQVLYKSREH